MTRLGFYDYMYFKKLEREGAERTDIPSDPDHKWNDDFYTDMDQRGYGFWPDTHRQPVASF